MTKINNLKRIAAGALDKDPAAGKRRSEENHGQKTEVVTVY